MNKNKTTIEIFVKKAVKLILHCLKPYRFNFDDISKLANSSPIPMEIRSTEVSLSDTLTHPLPMGVLRHTLVFINSKLVNRCFLN